MREDVEERGNRVSKYTNETSVTGILGSLHLKNVCFQKLTFVG